MGIAMTIYREERGACLIEAGALDLHNGDHWQPWIRLTRPAGGVSISHTFDGLKPVFGTEQAALRYAAELGRSLADEGSAPAPGSRDRKPATWPLNQAFPKSCAFRSRKNPLANGCRTATYMVRALTGIFARAEFAGDMARQAHIELYLAAAANHAELERRMREMERSAVTFAVTFSH
jgi:hypothetical protein